MAAKPLKHLQAALRRKAGPNMGACFYRASALTLDMPNSYLCIGTLKAATGDELLVSGAATEDFIHAWVEVEENVYAPTLLTASNSEMGPFPRSLYYDTNGIHDVHRMSHRELLRLSGDVRLSAHLRKNTPLRSPLAFGEMLLQALAVPYRERGGAILPPS